jgi:formylglycine-generating enzyme required for sulfatase activity
MLSSIFIKKVFHVYKFDAEGLHVRAKSLTINQEKALNSILSNMVRIEGGSFIMGNQVNQIDYYTDQDSLSRNPHQVSLDYFYICKYEVTLSQWEAFYEGYSLFSDEGNCAVESVSWEEANNFALLLKELTGLPFSLPTEAQWEFAARGGTHSRGYIFSGNDDANEVAWTSYDDLTKSHEVGGKRYNELGLFDMTGNVGEWCLDFFSIYDTTSVNNPIGPDKGMDKVWRGGDYRIDNLFDLKTTTRYHSSPFVKRRGTGLRLVINQ